MADMVLVYKFKELDECSEKMANVIDAVENIKGAVHDIRDSLVPEWEGIAWQAYAERCVELYNNLDRLYTEVSGNKTKLDKAIALQKQTEDELMKKIDDLSDGDIF